jgi:hypothetical protein
MKQPLIRKEHLGLKNGNGQRDLPQDLRAEAERRLQLAQSGTLNGSIATAYALLGIHDTLIKIEEHLITLIKIEEHLITLIKIEEHLITLIKIEEHLISALGRETQAPSSASDPMLASRNQITAA